MEFPKRVIKFLPIFLDIETTGLRPLEDRIVAIGIATSDDILHCVDLQPFIEAETTNIVIPVEHKEDEILALGCLYRLLKEVSEMIDGLPLLVGYNLGFDLSFISARGAVLYSNFRNGDPETFRVVRDALKLGGFLRELPRIDLMHLVTRYWLNNGRHMKMKDICSVLGIEYNDCNGSEIPELVKRGDAKSWFKIEQHLKADLERLKKLFSILRSQGLIVHNLKVRYNLMDAEVVVE